MNKKSFIKKIILPAFIFFIFISCSGIPVEQENKIKLTIKNETDKKIGTLLIAWDFNNDDYLSQQFTNPQFPLTYEITQWTKSSNFKIEVIQDNNDSGKLDIGDVCGFTWLDASEEGILEAEINLFIYQELKN